MEDINTSKVRERWAGCCKGDLPLVSSLRVIINSLCQRESLGKSDGKKKGMRKGRRSKE
jgi:hypothetical protein